MTKAVCFECGEFKFGALNPCPRCNAEPIYENDIVKSILLSDHNYDESKLIETSSQIRSGLIIEIPPETLERYKNELSKTGVLYPKVPQGGILKKIFGGKTKIDEPINVNWILVADEIRVDFNVLLRNESRAVKIEESLFCFLLVMAKNVGWKGGRRFFKITGDRKTAYPIQLEFGMGIWNTEAIEFSNYMIEGLKQGIKGGYSTPEVLEEIVEICASGGFEISQCQQEMNKAEFLLSKVIWVRCDNKNKLNERFFVPKYNGFLPFLVKNPELFDREQINSLSEKDLLRGILYGLYEIETQSQPPECDVDIDVFLYLLDVLGNGFGFDDPEKMLLDVATNVRIELGSSLSAIILKTGENLIPRSSKIKSDLILDLWIEISRSSKKEVGLLNEVIRLVENIDLDSIHAGAKEIVCYYGLCAHIFLNKSDSLGDYLNKYVYSNVTINDLKLKIKNLLEYPDDYIPSDMLVKVL